MDHNNGVQIISFKDIIPTQLGILESLMLNFQIEALDEKDHSRAIKQVKKGTEELNKNSNSWCLVALIKGLPIGYSMYSFYSNPGEYGLGKNYVEIFELFTDSKKRKEGVGNSLIDGVIMDVKRLKEEGKNITGIAAAVDPENDVIFKRMLSKNFGFSIYPHNYDAGKIVYDVLRRPV